MDTSPAPLAALHFELHVRLAPRPGGLQPMWQADLCAAGRREGLHFDSLPALIRYLAALETNGPPWPGIR